MWRFPRAWRRFTAFFVLGALIAAAILSGGGVALANHNFAAVPNSAGYHDLVDFLVQNGITSGGGPNQFCPSNAAALNMPGDVGA